MSCVERWDGDSGTGMRGHEFGDARCGTRGRNIGNAGVRHWGRKQNVPMW